MRSICSLCPALLLALLTTACSTENTCLPGNAMTNPRMVSQAQAVQLGSRWRIVWDAGTGRGAELGRSYFAGAKVNTANRDVGPDGPPMEEAVEAVGDREIAFIVRSPATAMRGALRFTIDFPDRKSFLGCERAEGAVDKYGLKVDAEIAGDGTVTKAVLTEIRSGAE